MEANDIEQLEQLIHKIKKKAVNKKEKNEEQQRQDEEKQEQFEEEEQRNTNGLNWKKTEKSINLRKSKEGKYHTSDAKTLQRRKEGLIESIARTKLLKLVISKFNGTILDWFQFWNQLQSEIDSNPNFVFNVHASSEGLPFLQRATREQKVF